jgi:hypothetical protein
LIDLRFPSLGLAGGSVISFLILALFEASSLRTQFQPFTDVPSENFAPRYKENGGNVPFSEHGLPGFRGQL